MDARAPQDDPQSPGLTPSLAKPDTGKEAGRRKARPQEKRVKRVRATRRGGREAPASSKGTKEDERQPATARPAARRRRSNPATPAAPTKGNHPGEAQVRRDRRKDPHRRERDPQRGPTGKQRQSARPRDAGKTRPPAKTHAQKRKECGRRRSREKLERDRNGGGSRAGGARAGGYPGGDPPRRRRPHTRPDREEDTSAPIETELPARPPPQQGPRGRRTKQPDR